MDVPNIIRVASLLRVSTTRVEQEESPRAQLAYIQEAILRHHSGEETWVDSGLVYQDELTGALVLERPDVKRALADANAGMFDMLAMKSISRMGRDTLGLLSFKRYLDDLNIELIALQDGYRSFRDLELIFLVHADRAQHGRLEISRNVRTNMRQKALQGKWVAGTVPFGYRRRNRHQLELHPHTAPIVGQIFDLRLAGKGTPSIARHLNELKTPTPSWWHFEELRPRWEYLATSDERWAARLEAKKRRFIIPPVWSTTEVLAILRNTAYRGELLYNRVFLRHRLGGKITRETRPQDEWISIPCPPLISNEEWDRAQKIGPPRMTPRRQGSSYLLTGLLYCGRCGGRMTGGGMHRREVFYRYYQCHNYRAYKTCHAPRIRADHLEAQILEHLQRHFSSLSIESPRETRSARSRQPRHHTRDLVKQLEHRLADLADERRYYRSEHRKARLTDRDLTSELDRMSREETSIRAEIARLTSDTRVSGPDNAVNHQELLGQTAKLRMDGLTTDDYRSLAMLAIEQIVVVENNELNVRWKFGLGEGGALN